MLYNLRIITDRWTNEEGDWYENDGYWYGEFEIDDKFWMNKVKDIISKVFPAGVYWITDDGETIFVLEEHGDEAIEVAYFVPAERAG